MSRLPKRVFLRINGRVAQVWVADNAIALDVVEAIQEGSPLSQTKIHVRAVFRA